MLNMIHDTPGRLREPPVIDPGIVDSKRLQTFYVSVKEGSFAGAAQILSVSPSAISHAMKSLEEDLGCSLFRRLGPQAEPTGAAVRLLPMVEDLLVKMSSMKSELAALDGRTEKLVFRLPACLLGMLRAGSLSTFHECFPAADLEMVVAGNGKEESLRKQVDFDVDFVERVPKDMVRRDLVDEDYHAVRRAVPSAGPEEQGVGGGAPAKCFFRVLTTLLFSERWPSTWDVEGKGI